MKNFKNFTKINENKTNIIDSIIDICEPTILSIIDKTKENMLKNNISFTERDIEYLRLSSMYDLLKSLSTYIDENDKLVEIQSSSDNGKLTITAIINRNETNYNLSTEVIYAGGYNIQRLHLRYITKSNLPKTNNSTITKNIEEQINSMKQEDKENSKKLLLLKGLERDEKVITKNISDYENGIGHDFDYIKELEADILKFQNEVKKRQIDRYKSDSTWFNRTYVLGGVEYEVTSIEDYINYLDVYIPYTIGEMEEKIKNRKDNIKKFIPQALKALKKVKEKIENLKK